MNAFSFSSFLLFFLLVLHTKFPSTKNISSMKAATSNVKGASITINTMKLHLKMHQLWSWSQKANDSFKLKYKYLTYQLTSVTVRRSLPYKSFLVTFSKACGNCTYAISWPCSSSNKKQRASFMD
ncbi:hypothetical protein PanWU01x14_273680 [Parasponia andersonii]|uniref:Uncharacterized protein n=1 Tax=Parasponia andersonii TaxID=3476 RepID=A0A2P5B3T0_PARAD|nr:hypothetical protein PanWU01x14_273680 [Parasponia andersonii]